MIIDSGSSSTVCGLPWVHNCARVNQLPIPKNFPHSRKSFRFGNNNRYRLRVQLRSAVLLMAVPPSGRSGKELSSLRMDIISLGIPLLISNCSLVSLQGSLHFGNMPLQLPSGLIIAMKPLIGRHVSFDWKPNQVLQSPVKSESIGPKIYVSQPGETINSTEIPKIHRQLGHSAVSAPARIFRLVCRNVAALSIDSAISAWSCSKTGHIPQDPTISKYVAEYHGRNILLDVFYPVSNHPRSSIRLYARFPSSFSRDFPPSMF